MNPKYTNHLIHESSPYLLQHAHNPVDWYPWNEQTLEKAKRENKLILISIGYSACHWCHVMERESFEDEATAQIMNEHFVCIKVDREERPDIDQVYMLAVQLMTGQGGWPLNCIALPDGRPIYGGTYFPNKQWKEALLSLATFYKENPHKAEEYASELTQGIHKAELIQPSTGEANFTIADAKAMVEPWKELFDNVEGGPRRAPKFPLPNNYEFLLRYYYHSKDASVLQHIKLTLDKMAMGGIYDQVGGGFARYSTDTLWKAPHFEKMGYDNGQLVSLYAHAYQLTQEPLYKEVVYETLDFISRELTSREGSFYSALDADSEGEEGKFYVWTKAELEAILGADFTLMSAYWNINNEGLWEHGNYILLRKQLDEDFAKANHIGLTALKQKVPHCKQLLLQARTKRISPGLDDKQLTSWNALLLKGYVDAYQAFGEPRFLQAAVTNAQFISKKLKTPDGGLFHNYKAGNATINGYLEDYAFTIEAFIALYEATFDEQWIKEARRLADYTIAHFHDAHSSLFYFTSISDKPLIARKMEINDNVIPASNSAMAKCLFRLSLYEGNAQYEALAKQMLNNVKENMPRYGSGYSNWGLLLLDMAAPFYEVAICGPDAEKQRLALCKQYIPNKLVAGSNKESALPLLQDRYQSGQTLIYVCEGKTCKRPVETMAEAMKQIGQ